MRSVDEHLDEILRTVEPLPSAAADAAPTPTAACWPRTSSRPVAIPPFDNSAMDGYAVRQAEVAGAGPESPVTLHVSGDLAAGSAPSIVVQPGFAVRIMTGAPVPPGADAVVPVEWTDGGHRTVTIQQAP